MKLYALTVSMLALMLAGCGGPTNAKDSRTSIATAPACDLTVELLTDTGLATGLNHIYLKITGPSGDIVTDAAVSFSPLMSMSNGTQHTCPTIGAPAAGSDGLYRSAVVFSMASSAMDIWSATVGITRPAADTVQASFPQLFVSDSGSVRMFTYADPATSATTRYIASLNFGNPPTVGLNPIILTLHTKKDMMTFLPVEDAALALDPEMPSMGHGSPGSVAPTPTSPGEYQGKLSFSMAGEWQTTVRVTRDGVVVGSPVFSTNF